MNILEQNKIMNAYYSDLETRDDKINTVSAILENNISLKKGDKVEDEFGNLYTIIDFSENINKVKKFDTLNIFDKENLKKLKNKNPLWVAVKSNNSTSLFTYGENGVTLIKEASISEKYKENNLIRSEFSKLNILNEDDSSLSKIKLTKKINDVNELFEKVENKLKSIKLKEQRIDSLLMLLEKDKLVSSESDLKDFGMAKAKLAFGDKADEKIVDSIIKNAIKKSTDKNDKIDWGKAVGIVNFSIGNN